jgi:hypothetical protein
MGLFSRDTEIYVSSVIYPLGEELDKIPDVVKAAVITASLQGSSRPTAINKAIFDGMGIKLRQGYSYANRSYYAGMPVSILQEYLDRGSDAMLDMLCEEYLATLYPSAVIDVKSVEIKYSSNADVVFRNIVETDYNYDFYEEAVHTAWGDVDVDAELLYMPLPYDSVSHEDEVGYQLQFNNPDTSFELFQVWYPASTFDGSESIENRLVMEVSIDSAPAITLTYSYGGSDPRLNLYLKEATTPQEGTFPAIVVKKALGSKTAVYLDDDRFSDEPWETSAAYRTSKIYARRLGFNLKDVINLVRDNPDQGKIDYAFIQPGTYITSPTLVAAEYHYNYFYRLYASYPDNQTAYNDWVTAAALPGVGMTTKDIAKNCPAQYVRIYDPDDTTNTVNMTIAWRYITYTEIAGVLDVAYEVECGTQEEVQSRYLNGRGTKTVTYDVTKCYFRRQLNETTYAEIAVTGLWHENYVFKGEKVQSAVWDMFNDPEGDFGTGFLIPLDYDIFISLSGRERLQLGQECMHIVFNCFKVVKEKWYETGIFKVILAIVAIVITIYSFGTLGPAVSTLYGAIYVSLPLIVNLTVTAAIAAFLTALIVATIYVGVSLAAKEAGEWAAEQWGPEWGAIVQIAVTVALTYAGGVAFQNIAGVAMSPITLSQQVLMSANYVLSGLAAYTDFAMQELQEAAGKWNDYITSPDNPLTEVERLLEEMFPDKSYIQAAAFPPRERLDEFLGRTLSLVDGLTSRLILPISNLSDLTLTTRLR